MRTDYAGHDLVYQRRRGNREYVGWIKRAELSKDWERGWKPLVQKQAFPKRGKLLELGCGAGNFSIRFAQLGYAVTGIDIAPTAIDWAVENAASANVNVRFIRDDVLTLARIPDASFDIALDGRCFHCIIGADRSLFLLSAYRVLKSGGILAVSSMCNAVPDTPYWRDYYDPLSRCTIHDGVATRYIGDSNEIMSEIMGAGFRVLDVEIVPPEDPEDLADLHVIAEKGN